MLNWRAGLTFRRFVGGLVVLVVALGPLQALPAEAQVVPPTEMATLLNNIELATLVPPSIDPSGITYLAHSDSLLVSDSEVDEERGNQNPPCDPPLPSVFDGANLFEVSRTGGLQATGVSPEADSSNVPDFFKEPTGLAYNPADRHVFISNDDKDRIYEMDAGPDGVYGTPDDTVTSFSTAAIGVLDPEDVAYDTASGDLFIADGLNREIYRVNPVTGALVSNFDVAADGLVDLEGIEYRASSDTLLVVDSGPNESVNEYSKDGALLLRVDIIEARPALIGVDFVPSDVAIAPASDGSGATSMYIVDRADDNGSGSDCLLPTDGRLYEMSAPFLATTPGGPPPPPPPPPPPAGLICGDDGFSAPFVINDLAGLSAEAVHAIQCLASYEITTGTGPGTFSPHAQVSRWQMAAFLIRQALVHGVNVPGGTAQGFTDIGSLDPTIQTNINQLAQLGITQGTSPTTFTPNQTVPRWQMAIFLARLLNEVGITLPSGTNQGFTDIGTLLPEAQTAINQLVQLGISTGTSATTFDPLSPVARWQMALFLNRTLEVGGTP